MISFKEQFKPPNFVDKEGNLRLIRCFNCIPNYGRENWLPAVASGKCAFCGWSKKEYEEKDDNTA